jgi:group I intron endonuclease
MKNITIKFILSKTNANYEEIHKTGVYKIYHINKPNIYYIGSATSIRKWRKGFKERWKKHLTSLNTKTHHSIYLQNVINKYGIDGIRFEILEFCSPDMCLNSEQKWLDFYKPFKQNGYNTCKIAGNTLGYRFPEYKKTNKKPIVQYSLEGVFIKDWSSLHSASRSLKIDVNSIKDCCKKRFKQAGGYIFRYKDDKDLSIKDKIKKPLIIVCVQEDKIICIGTISEIIDKVPDKRGVIYNSIRRSHKSKNNYKYYKKK